MDQFASNGAEVAGGNASDQPTPSFLDRLAQAMCAAAAHERDRIVGVLAVEAEEHAERARARSALEAAELRRLAEEELRGIDLWSAREIKRIRREAAKRSKDRRAELVSYLERHESIVAKEIAGVDAAVGAYTAELDRFVEELVAAGDPATIAGRADALPIPPDFDAVRAASRMEAVAALEEADTDVIAASMPEEAATEPDIDVTSAGVPVMDPDANGRAVDLPTPVVDETPATEVAAEAPASSETSNDHPNGAMRLIRALTPWASSPDAPKPDESEST
jgi:hypothetical protein